LRVLERPVDRLRDSTPLHANGSENDIRRQLIGRRISAATRREAGSERSNALLSLARTCAKHAIAP
jgi:hypothetical protein